MTDKFFSWALGSLALIVIVAFIVDGAQRYERRFGKMKSIDIRKTRKMVFGLLGVNFGLVVGLGLLIKYQGVRQFQFVSSQPSAHVVLKAGPDIELSSDDTRVLLKLIADAPGVWPHHSDPITICILDIPAESRFFYLLAKDSVRADDFWIFEGDKYENQPSVRQFRSPALTELLRVYGI